MACENTISRQTCHNFDDSILSEFSISDSSKAILRGFFKESDFLLLVIFDEKDCLDCNLQAANVWKLYGKRLDDLKTKLIFLTDIKNSRSFAESMNNYKINWPVFYDSQGEFFDKNGEILNEHLKTFVIDREFKFVWCGSPISTQSDWNSFVGLIREKL